MAGEGLGPVAISGASGLIGAALRRSLEADGIEVLPLVRSRGASGVFWDPEAGTSGTIDRAGLAGVRGVVHLAGESIAGGRWTEARKSRILQSRVRGTTLIAEAIASLDPTPAVFVSCSAIGFYGLRGAELLTETSAPGEGFLAAVCGAWESAAVAAGAAGVRVVHPRIGVVFAKEGGALAKMRLPFKLGVGGRVGDGEQYMSWITLPDVVAGLRRALFDPRLEGPVNLVAPEPVTNAELTAALGKALRRPTVFPVPRFAARAVFGGEMADELLLGGQRVLPAKLESIGFEWEHRTLEDALAYTESP